MDFDQSSCRQCGEALPIGANYCPGCGLARSTLLLDPLGVGDQGGIDARPVNMRSSRLRVLLGGGLVLAAVVAIGLALTVEGSEPDDASSEPVSNDDGSGITAAATSTTTTASTPTTTRPTAPESTDPPGPLVGYANETQGPVLGPDVEGAVVAVGERVLTRIDLVTGAIESIELDSYVDGAWEAATVLVDGRLLSTSTGNHLVLTDLTTGVQSERVRIDMEGFDFGGFRLIGRAGADSVWLAPDSGSDQLTAVEVDMSGTVQRRLELGSGFYAYGAVGSILYVTGGSGIWRYDSQTETSEPFGILGPPVGESMIVASCRPNRACVVSIETASGLESVPGLSEVDVGNAAILVSPDRKHAVVTEYGSGQPQAVHVDLSTGQRTELGSQPAIDPFTRMLWIADEGWILGRVTENGRRLFAVEVETAEQVQITLPVGADGFGLDPWSSRLIYQPGG